MDERGITAKCATLVSASRGHVFEDVEIDWGINSQVPFQSTMGVQPLLYSGMRYTMLALAEGTGVEIPNTVTISALRRSCPPEVLRLTLPVQVVDDWSRAGGKSRHGTCLLHSLAAHRIISDLEQAFEEVPRAKELIVHLGTKYQLASHFTSLVAVDVQDRQVHSDDTLTIEELLQGAGWECRGPMSSKPPPKRLPEPPTCVSSGVEELIGIQRGDGGFEDSDKLREIIGSGLVEAFDDLSIGHMAWATALAIAYLARYMTGQPELLNDIVGKASECLETLRADSDPPIEQILDHAEKRVYSARST